jgi:branched-chain amino acid transport system ATP-binding protein
VVDVISIQDLEAGYGPLHVLFGITTTYHRDLITAIVGPNGSGKSTLLKTIFGLTKVFKGRIVFDGRDITGKPPHFVSRLGIAYLPQRQLVAMAMALIRRPKVMLFDEPTANLSPKFAKLVLDQIVRLRDDLKITVLLVEQNALRALEHGDRAQLLVSGQLIYDGPARDLLENRELGRIYLGLRS